jgi:hypothetical protein
LKAKDRGKKYYRLLMTTMPLEYFGYYSLLVEPFADGYYKIGDKVKAQQLLNGEVSIMRT